MKKLLKKSQKGFTLLELLIVIAIIAILSVVLILVLDPAETLKKARDAQRIADLNTMKTAIGIFTTTTSTPFLAFAGGVGTSTGCKTGTGGGSYPGKVWYSVASDTQNMTGAANIDGSAGTASATQVFSSSTANTDGTGWIPVNLSGLTSGSPISNLPVDPTNSISAPTAPTNADLVYRYACNGSTTQYEIDATLESQAYTVADNKAQKDGGNNTSTYEIGTNLKILGSGNNF